MTVSDDELAAFLETALDTLRRQPKNLAEVLDFVANTNDRILERPLARLVEHVGRCGPNDRIRHALTMKLQPWDHEESPAWSSTDPHSSARRADALRLLGFSVTDFETLNAAIPIFTETEVPIVIAEDHRRWYEDRKPLIRSFYWEHYTRQLAKPKGTWSAEAIATLNVSTDDVLARLADPTQHAIYQVKGLVMGYVQSGKTSHFTGLISKAADAGYRLIIVFAGTMDILREQTQRRIDKEIVGKELLGPDEYGTDSDWGSFVEHSGRPSDLGSFDWTRLTDSTNDYSRLEQHLTVLEFRPADPSKPFNHPDNLRRAPARLAVIKKTPDRIGKLCDDLTRLRALRNALEYVPTLIIDDESDQASINTVDPKKTAEKNERTSTNKAIGQLLKLLPRAQYVGYTATPFANVFINPQDADDLFPKDFIVSLPKPEGYMGVSDFYDFDAQYEDTDVRSNRAAFVRPVEAANEADVNLPRAIDSFVLAGAIKLYRQHCAPRRYTFRHHTMLVHHSARRAVHADDAQDVRKIFGGGSRYQNREGVQRLRKLFEDDFLPVSRAHDSDAPFPKTFDELKPFISECVTRICDEKSVLIVNGDNRDDTPDFDEKAVWAILVGGAKLSRGYTVEGLTTSYFRRPAGAGDTLMQMGRWFGFRPGYRDLVRLYIGKKEQRGSRTIDLYEAFGAVCRDEEALRQELLRYGKGDLTPKQVPPLVRQHLPQLPPAAKNKMFNAQIRSLDLAGEWTEKTSAPVKQAAINHNLRAAGKLLAASQYKGRHHVSLVNSEGVKRRFDTYVGIADGNAVSVFLETYQWSEGKQSVRLEVDYVQEQLKSGGLGEWTILAPQVENVRTFPIQNSGYPDFAVISRSRVTDYRFGVYSEPRHRDAAESLAGISNATSTTQFFQTYGSSKRAVLVMYLVDEVGKTGGDPSIGFGIQFPGEKKSKAITWSVVDSRHKDEVVVRVRKL